jgi:hypothetical protein
MNSNGIVILSSILSTATTLIVVLINNYIKRKKSSKRKYNVFKNYANPIVLSSELLVWRLIEILECRAFFLNHRAKESNQYYKYKFESTVYRLNSLLGWIQAAQKEQFYFQGIRKKYNSKLQDSISKFKSVLADGAFVEESILKDLSKLFDLKLSNITENKKSDLALKIEKIIFSYLPDNLKTGVLELPAQDKIELLKDILIAISTETRDVVPSDEVIFQNLGTSINEIARRYFWIYRDWQSTIGEEMMVEAKSSHRQYRILSYSEYLEKKENNNWLSISDKLFLDLDPSKCDKYDVRVNQLFELVGSLNDILNIFKKLVKKDETISEKSLYRISNFYSENKSKYSLEKV